MREALDLTVGDLVFDGWAEGPADGEPVLLLHGFPESARCWSRVQPQLAAAGYRSVAPDLRGYSPRARPTDPSDYAIEALVGDVTGLADTLGWGAFHLVGHDWGGALAWHTAGRHPDRLRTLSVVSTPHPQAFHDAKKAGPSADGDDQAARSGYMHTFREPGAERLFLDDDGAVLRLVYGDAGLDEADVAHYVDRFTEPGAMVAALNWYRGADPSDAAGLGPITTPTLYVWSTDDIALGRTAAELTGGCVDGPYRFEVLDGVSHWIPEAAADELSALLVAHLRSA